MTYGYMFTVLGLIFFVEGVPYLADPNRVKKWLEWLLTVSSRDMRLIGAGLMVVGLLFVYWGRGHGG
ncbi:MAG: DUF2065 domain-containing protein [Desulfobacteraceae bacterium]|nr:DUF2065 domain-containing protein [Desulfobacteraceae bacterium]